MYSAGTSVPIKSSSSLLYNNFDALLSENPLETLYGIVHKSTVWLFNPKAALEGDSTTYKRVICKGEGSHSSSLIFQAKWCVLAHRTLLVVTSVKGTQFFEPDGSIMVFWQSLSPSSTEGLAQYARGISGVGEKHICFGTADGSILVFDVPSKGNGVKLQETLNAHDQSITELHTSNDTMISGDEKGKIVVWKAGGYFQKLRVIDGYNYPASSIRLWKNFVVAGYGSGHVRVFNSETGVIIAEIAAHARWINAIDIAEDSGILLTTSEDSYFRIWNLSNFEVVQQTSIGDIQITGAKFLDSEGTKFGLTGYDLTDVLVYQKT